MRSMLFVTLCFLSFINSKLAAFDRFCFLNKVASPMDEMNHKFNRVQKMENIPGDVRNIILSYASDSGASLARPAGYFSCCNYVYRNTTTDCSCFNHIRDFFTIIRCGCFNTTQNLSANQPFEPNRLGLSCCNHLSAKGSDTCLACCNTIRSDSDTIDLSVCNQTFGNRTRACCSACNISSGNEARLSYSCCNTISAQRSEIDSYSCCNEVLGHEGQGQELGESPALVSEVKLFSFFNTLRGDGLLVHEYSCCNTVSGHDTKTDTFSCGNIILGDRVLTKPCTCCNIIEADGVQLKGCSACTIATEKDTQGQSHKALHAKCWLCLKMHSKHTLGQFRGLDLLQHFDLESGYWQMYQEGPCSERMEDDLEI